MVHTVDLLTYDFGTIGSSTEPMSRPREYVTTFIASPRLRRRQKRKQQHSAPSRWLDVTNRLAHCSLRGKLSANNYQYLFFYSGSATARPSMCQGVLRLYQLALAYRFENINLHKKPLRKLAIL